MSVDLDTVTIEKLKEPSRYTVVFLNDDFTPMDFVVKVLMEVFGHTLDSAYAVMMEVHMNGKGAAGIYSYEIAQQKQLDCLALAQAQMHPLRVILEQE